MLYIYLKSRKKPIVFQDIKLDDFNDLNENLRKMDIIRIGGLIFPRSELNYIIYERQNDKHKA